jgi:hypothetical protein
MKGAMSKKDSAAVTRPTPPRRRPRRGSGVPWLLPVGASVAVMIALVATLVLYTRPGNAAGQAPGQTIDRIPCQPKEWETYHIHAHLAIFANGQPRTIPLGIGIPNAQAENTEIGPFVTAGYCFYWLHSHATDGVVHVESPRQRQFTLGNYFDIWGEPLSATRVGADTGPVIAYVNGRRYAGNPRAIPLTFHGVIQLDVGTDVAPQPYTFMQGL